MKKRGLNSLISSVLIIFLAIVAVIAVWVMFNSFVSQGIGKPGFFDDFLDSLNLQGQNEQVKGEKLSEEVSNEPNYIITLNEKAVLEVRGEELKKTNNLETQDIKKKIKEQETRVLNEHAKIKNDFSNLKVRREYKNVLNGMAVSLNEKDVEKLKAKSYVKSVNPVVEVKANLMDSVSLINADDVWRLDSNLNGCSNPSSYRAFITSQTFDGNLGGLEGADLKCQEAANSSGLGGKWKAYIGKEGISPESIIFASEVPYKKLDGTLIANHYNDLTDGKIASQINIDEFGHVQNSTYYYAWTGDVGSDGKVSSCRNWTYDNKVYSNGQWIVPRIWTDYGSAGIINWPDYRQDQWSKSVSSGCHVQNRLYCIEQPTRKMYLGFSSILNTTDNQNDAIASYDIAAQNSEYLMISTNVNWTGYLLGWQNVGEDSIFNSAKLFDYIARIYGLKIYVSIDPLEGTDRSRIDQSIPYEDKNFANEDVRISYKNFVQRVVSELNPDYLTLGLEVNTYYNSNPADFENFVSLYNETYDLVKQPGMKIAPSFQWDEVKHNSEYVVFDYFKDKSDYMGLSTYPRVNYATPQDIPIDYYSSISQYTNKPIVITESGWPTDSTAFPSSEEAQAEFLDFLLTEMDQLNTELVVWWFMHDWEYGGYPGSDFFKSMGLLKSDGLAKQAWSIWKEWNELSIEQQECTETDGGVNAYEQGNTCYGEECIVDSCLNDNMLQEYFCEDGKRDFAYMGCGNGCGYESGECMGSCWDSDNGLNFNTKGMASGKLWNGEVKTNIIDSCITSDEENLLEWYCASNGQLAVYYHTCPNGCIEGACNEKRDYLILTADQYLDDINEFVNYRKADFDVHVVKKSDIPNANNPEEVRQYLIDYTSSNNLDNLSYILIIGNTSVFPAFVFNSQGFVGSSDFNYSNIFLNGDIPDFAVGRIPCANSTELQTILRKTMENEPVEISKSLLFGKDTEFAYYASDRHKPFLEANSFEVVLINTTLSTSPLYNPAIKAQVLEESKTSKLFVYYGHAALFHMPPFLDRITGPIPGKFILLSGGCSTLDFASNEKDLCIGYDFLKQVNGSLASVGAVVGGGYGYDYKFIEGFYLSNKGELGQRVLDGLVYEKADNLEHSQTRHDYYKRLTILGDPALKINIIA
jgi:hypothetical protein